MRRCETTEFGVLCLAPAKFSISGKLYVKPHVCCQRHRDSWMKEFPEAEIVAVPLVDEDEPGSAEVAVGGTTSWLWNPPLEGCFQSLTYRGPHAGRPGWEILRKHCGRKGLRLVSVEPGSGVVPRQTPGLCVRAVTKGRGVGITPTTDTPGTI